MGNNKLKTIIILICLSLTLLCINETLFQIYNTVVVSVVLIKLIIKNERRKEKV